MATDEKDRIRILHLRNEISLCLDDLAAQVVNSSLASSIRRFSSEVMELEPGFAFGLKQAKALKERTSKTEKQYGAKTIDDTALMDYLNEAQSILKGETIRNGGEVFMDILNRLMHSTDYKVRRLTEIINKQELQLEEICKEIKACKAEMSHYVEASRSCDPNSWEYRSNERKYLSAKGNLTLKNKEAEALNKILSDNISKLQLLSYGEVINDLHKGASKSPLTLEDQEGLVATLQHTQNELKEILATSSETNSVAYEESEIKVRPDSEFAAEVAASARREAMREMAGVDVSSEKDSESQNEFSRLVNGDNAKE